MKTDNFWTTKGRITRLSYLLRVFPLILIQLAIFLFNKSIIMTAKMTGYLNHYSEMQGAMIILLVLAVFNFVLLWIQLTKRLHDINFSGWVGLCLFIPVIGFLLIVVLFFISGTKGENKYGADPRQLKKQGA